MSKENQGYYEYVSNLLSDLCEYGFDAKIKVADNMLRVVVRDAKNSVTNIYWINEEGFLICEQFSHITETKETYRLEPDLSMSRID